jgi:DNA-binding GntR family transcriptional regulator
LAALEKSEKRAAARPGQLVAELASRIRLSILKGDLAPGERVRETVIASAWGTSRAPVREALRLLEQSGIISKSPNRSYFVTRFGERDIHELATLRAALESLAARLAFGRAELLPALTAAMPAIRKAVQENDFVAAMQADREFHEALISCADHGRLSDAYASLSDQVELAYIEYYRRRPDISQLVARHDELLEIVRAGSVEDLVAELTDQIKVGLGRVRTTV